MTSNIQGNEGNKGNKGNNLGARLATWSYEQIKSEDNKSGVKPGSY